MMPRKLGYIDEGDVIRVKNVEGGGTYMDGVATNDKRFKGMIGMVTYNNGWGLCTVRFANGEEAQLWNERDLEYVSGKEIQRFLRRYNN